MKATAEIIGKVLREGRQLLLEHEAKTVCSEYGIPSPPFHLVDNEAEAILAAEQLGYPIVLKIVSPHILHKTEARGIVLNISNPSELKKAYSKIIENARKYDPDATILGVLVQKMAPPSLEMIAGALKDPNFGQMVMVGMGGIYVEIYKDVSFRVAPIDRTDAEKMIDELKGSILLKGFRGNPRLDENSVIDTILNVSKLVTDHDEIKQLDLNPLIVYEKGIAAVDARMILEA